MAISVVMPALEMAQETGKLISWLKKEGESVAKGEPLLEIETDKVVMEIESPGDGVLAGVKVQAGTEVPAADEIAAASGRRSTVPALFTAPAASTAASANQLASPAQPAQSIKISP